MREGGAAGDKCVLDGRFDMRIAERTDRVEALLIGGEPKNVGAINHGG